MKSFLAAAMLCAVALPNIFVTAFAQEANPAYLIARLKVADLDAYMRKYGMPVFPLLAQAGAEVLVGASQTKVLEGTNAATWTAVVRFPSMQALETWYESDAYQAIAPERRKLSDEAVSTLIAAPVFVMPKQ